MYAVIHKKMLQSMSYLYTCTKTYQSINFQFFVEKLLLLNYFVFAWLHDGHHINNKTVY